MTYLIQRRDGESFVGQMNVRDLIPGIDKMAEQLRGLHDRMVSIRKAREAFIAEIGLGG